MSVKRYVVFYVAIPLAIGFSIYALLKSPIPILKFVFTWESAPVSLGFAPKFIASFLKFHLADMLWAFSFCAALNLVISKSKFVCIFVAVLIAGLELLQYVNIISGTGDILDVLFSIFSVFLFYYTNKTWGLKDAKIQ